MVDRIEDNFPIDDPFSLAVADLQITIAFDAGGVLLASAVGCTSRS
ncbi:hypothetical protein OG205_17600 [Lentzea sp. NBC_00516]|nr:hypothetical protein [Lentzea sp. NBC_00516]WUD28746.1 hypothetical protein OG205_17600 [Lentzea sp. NBC_00516]